MKDMNERPPGGDEADLAFWWSLEYDEELDLVKWINQPDVGSVDAAMLLCGKNPKKDKARDHELVQKLALAFDQHSASSTPQQSTLLTWLALARRQQLAYAADVAQEIDAIVAKLGLVEIKAAAIQLGKGKGTPPKLTDEQDAEIVRLYQNGRGTSVAELARNFDVSRRTIDLVLSRAGVKTVTLRKERSQPAGSRRR